MSPRRRLVAVIGSGEAGPELRRHAREVGASIAARGHGLVCGGLGGVMEAACAGAARAPGAIPDAIVGLLPGTEAGDANRHVGIAIPTGLGIARNVLVVRSAAAVVAVGGESGTLSEIAHAWQLGRPVAAWVPAGGWAAHLAGERIDGRRDDRVEPLESVEELNAWLDEVMGSGS